MITVISLLVLARMQHLLMYTKGVSRMIRQHQNFYQLESEALRMLNHSLSYPCVRKQNAPNSVLEALRKKKGCHSRTNPAVYYFIEDLGIIDCLVNRPNDKLVSTQHWRYSLMFFEEKQPAFAVQLRVINPAQEMLCKQKMQYVSLGIGSWRYRNMKE